MTAPTKVLLVSGSLRAESVNSARLRTGAAIAGDGIHTTLYRGMGALPHFNPDDDPDGGPVPAAVADLRFSVRCGQHRPIRHSGIRGLAARLL